MMRVRQHPGETLIAEGRRRGVGIELGDDRRRAAVLLGPDHRDDGAAELDQIRLGIGPSHWVVVDDDLLRSGDQQPRIGGRPPGRPDVVRTAGGAGGVDRDQYLVDLDPLSSNASAGPWLYIAGSPVSCTGSVNLVQPGFHTE
jgi:hypothetical protein